MSSSERKFTKITASFKRRAKANELRDIKNQNVFLNSEPSVQLFDSYENQSYAPTESHQGGVPCIETYIGFEATFAGRP